MAKTELVADEPDITPELGRRVTLLRQQSGMSQQTLAEASGLTVQAISRIERAAREPRINTLVCVASGLGVTLSDLLDLGERPTRPQPSLREDVQALAGYLNGKPLAQVRLVARLARTIVEDAEA